MRYPLKLAGKAGAVAALALTGVLASSAHEAQPIASAASPVVLGLSNSDIISGWRAQMINDFKAEAQRLKAHHEISRFVANSSGDDVAKQIQQIHDMVASGVNVLVVDAASATGLNSAIDHAVSQGVTVVSFDNTVTTTKATNLLLDENIFAGKTAQGLAQLMHYRGNVLMLNGVAGAPVNEKRIQIATAIFARHPKMHVIQVNVNWNPALAKLKTAQILSQGKKIDGVWDQGDSAAGAAAAFRDAGKKLPPIVEDGTTDFLKIWHQKLSSGYKTVGSLVPPIQVLDAIWVGLMEHNGYHPKTNPVIMPTPYLTNQNVNKFWKPNLPSGLFVDAVPVPRGAVHKYLTK